MPKYKIIKQYTLVDLKWSVNNSGCEPQGGLVVWRDDDNRLVFAQAVVCHRRGVQPAARKEGQS